MFSSISTQSTLYQIFPSSLREISPYLYLTEGNKNVNLSSIVQVEDQNEGGKKSFENSFFLIILYLKIKTTEWRMKVKVSVIGLKSFRTRFLNVQILCKYWVFFSWLSIFLYECSRNDWNHFSIVGPSGPQTGVALPWETFCWQVFFCGSCENNFIVSAEEFFLPVLILPLLWAV